MNRKFYNTQDIIDAHKGHFFEPGTLRFFRSRVLSECFEGAKEVFFVTSEQFRSMSGVCKPRRYTVRAFNPETDDIRTVQPFNELSRYQALKTARELAQEVFE